ncbi:probable inositol oxygenase [Rhynchosporium agropyri]|uniref:Inositol oxygenase n=1 Tax=Rhynchosporium agropyri TaxID=914238 RepID=A0A1E1LPM6_9HELO|nr:probable inositol oxygenase [Rhynchosporium agropyri]
MAPSATSPYPSRSGADLEDVSDMVDEINIKKAALRAQEALATTDESKSVLEKEKSQFREYLESNEPVYNLYKEQHIKQTVAYNIAVREKFQTTTRAEMSVWEAMEKLNTFIDESDPDTSLSQIEHLIQSAEAMRRDGRPRWMQVTGLVHDLGKLLFFYGASGQWDVVGDTFPVGCAFSDKIVYPETMALNPDYNDPRYNTQYGIYSPGCGLDKVMLSWGHDEYLYHVFKDQSTLPEEALAMIRYHSFYPWHSGGAYCYLMSEKDEKMLEAVRAFNPYDLYSKSDEVPSVEELKPYYLDLIDEFFPKKILKW